MTLRTLLRTGLALALLLGGALRGADPKAPMGACFYGFGRGDTARLAPFLDRLQGEGFTLVTFTPTYTYAALDRISFERAAPWDELGAGVETALRRGLTVVLKPHLEPALYEPGFDSAHSENDSWRARINWRGFFDVDPMTPDYRDKLVFGSLRMLGRTLDKLKAEDVPVRPVRFELGAELMNSVVYHADAWRRLGLAARRERDRLGLRGRVLLSHNFSHHFMLPEDFVLRMTPRDRRALAAYLRGLDALALSQYMDLTAAVPPAERGHRPPTAAEIADALELHDRNLRTRILGGLLGLKPAEIPPLHIGEFGIGTAGLRHPNLWDGPPPTGPAEAALQHEVALGHAGLRAYLARGRGAQSASLWVTGRYFDLFGWQNPAEAVTEAVEGYRAAGKSDGH